MELEDIIINDNKSVELAIPKKYEHYNPDWEMIMKTIEIKRNSGAYSNGFEDALKREIINDFSNWKAAQDLLQGDNR